MNIKQSKNWGNYLETLGWVSVYKPQAIRIKPLLFWSIIKIQRPHNLSEFFLKKVDSVARKERALFAIIEPTLLTDEKFLPLFKYRKTKEPLSFTKTILIDLKPDLKKIFRTFSKDTKQRLKKRCLLEEEASLASDRKNPKISIYKIDNEERLREFYSLFKDTAKQKKFWVPSFNEMLLKAKSFKNSGFLTISYQKNIPTAAAFILLEEDTAYYEHAAHNPRLDIDAPYEILFETIKECKKRSCSSLDLCGIYDGRFLRATKKWKRFSVFKRKWGGKEVLYAYPHIKYFWPFYKEKQFVMQAFKRWFKSLFQVL